MSGTFPNVVYFEDFNTPGPATTTLPAGDWEVYGDYAGNAGFGFRMQSQCQVVVEPTSTSGGKVLRLTAQNVGGQLWSGGMQLHKPRTYGQYEIRVRVAPDASLSTSGVVLLWPNSNQWPRDGEIDFSETYGNRDTRTPFTSFIHRLNPAATLPYDGADDELVVDHPHTGLSQADWHKLVMSWAPDEIYIEIDNGSKVVLTSDPANIPDWDMNLCLQLDAWSNTPPSTPVTMDIDYVLVREFVAASTTAINIVPPSDVESPSGLTIVKGASIVAATEAEVAQALSVTGQTPAPTSNLKAWNGSAWVAVTPRYFNAAGQWVPLETHVNYHNGTTWVTS